MKTFTTFALAYLVKFSLATVTVSGNGAVTIGNLLFHPQDIISRDVAILGGGSTGTYSAVRLSQDLGKSVIVIENNGRFGRHTHTYIDPITGLPFYYGVIGFHNYPTVTNYFNRFNISLYPLPSDSPFTEEIANFRTGKFLPNYVAPTPEAMGAGLGIWYSICAKYPTLPYGYNLTYPVDPELLATFSETIAKFSHSLGNMMSLSTLYVIQNFGLPQLAFDYLTTTAHYNSQLYIATAGLLGNNVLYNSTATKVYRDAPDGNQYLIIQTPKGQKLIKAKKLLVTFAPSLENLAPFSLSSIEQSVFGQFIGTPYYAGIIRNGIAFNLTITNVDPAALFSVPVAPFIEMFEYIGVPGLHHFYIEFTSKQTIEQVKKFVLGIAKPLSGKGEKAASVEVLMDHSPTGMRFSPKAVKGGIHKKLAWLQGTMGTFWTGLAWAPEDSGLLWRFTDLTVLPALVASLV